MKRSERLDVVQQATARTEREHAERVADAQRQVAQMEEKLAALEKYRGEYEAGFAARSRKMRSRPSGCNGARPRNAPTWSTRWPSAGRPRKRARKVAATRMNPTSCRNNAQRTGSE
jgi:hypothetical protein